VAKATPSADAVCSAELAMQILAVDAAVLCVAGNFGGVISGLSLCVWAAARWHTRELSCTFAVCAAAVLACLLVCDVKKQCDHALTETVAFCASTTCTVALLAVAGKSRDKAE
jgi:hypothetical protein